MGKHSLTLWQFRGCLDLQKSKKICIANHDYDDSCTCMLSVGAAGVEVTYPVRNFCEPLTCDDVNFSGYVVPLRFLAGQCVVVSGADRCGPRCRPRMLDSWDLG